MFEQQMETLAELNSKASRAIVKYYSELDKPIEDKLYNLEAALAEIDILLMYITQVRYEIRAEIPNIPASGKHNLYDCLEELRTIQDAAKTVSYNLTAAIHSLRDLLKVNL